jgi:hypothetical protein
LRGPTTKQATVQAVAAPPINFIFLKVSFIRYLRVLKHLTMTKAKEINS